jgi:outer membrane protease
MSKLIGLRGLAGTLMACVCTSAMAADRYVGVEEYEGISFWGSVGVVALEANEYVYVAPGSDTRLSHLIWQSTAPVLSAGLDVKLPDGWTVAAKGQFALGGDSYMEDYDWIDPWATGTGDGDWSHRSQHDDTDLDWYFNGSILFGYNIAVGDTVTVNLNGGFKYTDVQWAAYGGSYVYSNDNDGPRGDVGNFANGEPGITYRQTFPAVVAGLDIQHSAGPLTLGASAHAGLTFSAVGDDYHWMRNRNFVDHMQSAPLVAVSASVDYEVADGMHLFVQGTAEQTFTARADTDIYYISSGAYDESYPDAAGGDLFAASLSLGVKGKF